MQFSCFNRFFLLSYRQAGRNQLKHKLPQYTMFIWSCVLVYRETGVYWDLVYKDKQQYTEFCKNRAGKSVKQVIYF